MLHGQVDHPVLEVGPVVVPDDLGSLEPGLLPLIGVEFGMDYIAPWTGMTDAE